MATEREETLKKAEKLLRQGKLDLAIAEYVRAVEEQPRDWNTRNTLGDLYVRAGEADKAAAQYAQIGDHLMNEGFYPQAAALYKKILKINPDDETVQLNLAEISVKQGLLADAKEYFTAVAARRRARGDRAAADEIVTRLGSLDPGDVEARGLAARTLAENGDLEAAKRYLDRAIAGEDPTLLMALLEIELRAGAMDSARDILAQLLDIDVSLRTRIVELAWTLAPTTPEAAFVCVDTVVDAELGAGNYMDAAAILQEFVTRASGQIGALLKLVEICVDGGLEATMSETQAHLADAYLERGQGAEARVIAENLVAREPWEHAHIDRFRRALVLLNVADPDALIAERLSGQGPFVATDPFMAPESSGDPEPATEPSPIPEEDPRPSRESIIDPGPPVPPRRDPEPDIPLRPRVPPQPPEPPPAGAAGAARKKKSGELDIDLTEALAELQGMTSVPAPEPAAPAPPQNLDQVFDDFRSEVSRHTGAKDAAEQLALAKTYLDMGMADEAIGALTAAARSPGHRFEAASLLGRMYLKRKDVLHAIEWLERAAEAPAPGVNEARALLYDLGSTLEASGETSRALAVFLELQADAGDYRDVAVRVDRLARVQAGG